MQAGESWPKKNQKKVKWGECLRGVCEDYSWPLHKGDTNPQNDLGSIRAKIYLEFKNQHHSPRKTTISQILSKVWSPMAVAIFDKKCFESTTLQAGNDVFDSPCKLSQTRFPGQAAKVCVLDFTVYSLVHDYKCWFFNNFLQINILLSINCDFFHCVRIFWLILKLSFSGIEQFILVRLGLTLLL